VIVLWALSILTIAPAKVDAASLVRKIATAAQSRQIVAIVILVFFIAHLRAITMVVLVRQRADGLLSAAYGIFPRAASGFLMRKWFAKHHEANKR